VKGRRGGLWVAIRPHQPIPDDAEFLEAKIKRKRKGWFMDIAGVVSEPAHDWGNDNQTSETTQLVEW